MNKIELGINLMYIRKQKQISLYYLEKNKGLRFDIAKSIENGNKNYCINSLMDYIDGIGCKIEIIDK